MNSANLNFSLDSDDAAEQSHNNEAVDHQFLTFTLAGEEYGINIIRVQEIKGWLTVTAIPNTPEYITGVLNLRGNIVPVIDLRCRFNLGKLEQTQNTVIIVLSVNNNRNVGIVVDAVSDVLNVNDADIKEPPEFGLDVDVNVIDGLVACENKLVMLMDIEKILLDRELHSIEERMPETDNN